MKRKLFSDKTFSKEKLLKLLDKEGFYVVVFLCVAVIATTAVYVTRNNLDYFTQNNKEDSKLSEKIDDHEYFQPEDIQPEPPEKEQQTVASKDKEANKEQDKEKEENKEKPTSKETVPNATEVMSPNGQENKETPKSTEQNSAINMERPVGQNTITMDYSYQTQPVFSQTLNEFRSDHQGIDIEAAKGTVVKAALEGKVIDIQQDAKLGTLITLDHGNGIKTKYGNLDKKVDVQKNQQVKKGQALGKAGNTAMFEIEDDPHIHFEVWKGDQPQDPKNYIKDLKLKKE